MMDSDIKSCLESVDWCRADYEYFRGGGFSSHFKTMAEMPVTTLRINLVDGVGPTIQIAEGYTVVIDEEIHKILDQRTDQLGRQLGLYLYLIVATHLKMYIMLWQTGEQIIL